MNQSQFACVCVCVCVHVCVGVCVCVHVCVVACMCITYRISNIAINVDLALTILDMGRVPVPPHMDGTSLLPLLKATMDMQR